MNFVVGGGYLSCIISEMKTV